jgi:hypothetical protein
MVRILLEELWKRIKKVANKLISAFLPSKRVKRPGIHSKNASPGKRGHKKSYRGQGR